MRQPRMIRLRDGVVTGVHEGDIADVIPDAGETVETFGPDDEAAFHERLAAAQPEPADDLADVIRGCDTFEALRDTLADRLSGTSYD